MWKIAVALFAAVSAPSIVHADPVSDLVRCKAEPDSLKRLNCYDAIAVQETQNPSPVLTPASAPISMTDVQLRIQMKDVSSRIYHNRLEVVPTFKNMSDKTVVAIEHTLKMTDAFGEAVVDSTSKLDIKIPPKKTVQSETFYFFEDNPFIYDEAYDKLSGSVSNGSAKATMTVVKAVFSDGTTASYK